MERRCPVISVTNVNLGQDYLDSIFYYVDFLQRLVDYEKEGAAKSLYVNSGKNAHHYSPKGNHILAQTIAERLESDFDMNNSEPFSYRNTFLRKN